MADAPSPLSPEKRLLKLIEDPAGENAAPGGVKAAPKPPPWLYLKAALSPEKLAALLPLMQEKGRAFLNSFKDTSSLKSVNRILTIAAVFLGVVLFFNTLMEVQTLDTEAILKRLGTPAKVPDIGISESMNANADFLEGSKFRNIFMPFQKRIEIVKTKSETSEKLVEMIKNLKLTGISYNPEDPSKAFCMIEDLEKNITTFLRKGDRVGALSVKAIEPESIKLEYQGEEIEVR